MILRIENLGAIKQASFDFDKKFTLLCGRNSTGKTYAAYILYAFWSGMGLFDNLGCIKSIGKQIADSGEFKVEKAQIEEWLSANCESLKSRMGIIFGVSDDTSKKLFGKLSLAINYTDEDYARSLQTTINATLKEGSLIWKITKSERSDVVRIESNSDLSTSFAIGGLRTASIVCGILRSLALCGMPDARMLTVERNSIYTFKTELSLSRNELIDRIQQKSDNGDIDIFGMINSSSRRYPQAVSSSLRIANDLGNVQKSNSTFADVAKLMERNLLGGEVNVTKEGDVEFHADNMAKNKRIPFHLSSSIVKTMASLVVYLKHIAQKGDTLIIDEPEMNFHPDVQVLLSRLFVMLTLRGLRVMVSTHSDYIVRELNNLIMAHSLSVKGHTTLAKELGYDEEMLLAPNDTAVLFFEQNKKNMVQVKSLPIDETGFAVSTIDDTITNQNETAQALYIALNDTI